MSAPHDLFLQEVVKHVSLIPGTVPAHRKASRHRYSFSDLSFPEQLQIWDHIWNRTNGFWIRVHAHFFLERHLKKDELLEEMWPVIVKWQDSVDDWGLNAGSPWSRFYTIAGRRRVICLFGRSIALEKMTETEKNKLKAFRRGDPFFKMKGIFRVGGAAINYFIRSIPYIFNNFCGWFFFDGSKGILFGLPGEMRLRKISRRITDFVIVLIAWLLALGLVYIVILKLRILQNVLSHR